MPPQTPFNMVALTATIRYSTWTEYDMFNGDPTWIRLSSVHLAKRRFQTVTMNELADLALQEKDSMGRNRFKIHTDTEGTMWIQSVMYSERN